MFQDDSDPLPPASVSAGWLDSGNGKWLPTEGKGELDWSLSPFRTWYLSIISFCLLVDTTDGATAGLRRGASDICLAPFNPEKQQGGRRATEQQSSAELKIKAKYR